jgi:hypothetical protein
VRAPPTQLIRAARGVACAAGILPIVLIAAIASARADAETLATERGGAGFVVLWNGGVAYWGEGGIRSAAPGSPSHLVHRFPYYGSLSYNLSLDGGTAAGASSGALTYGWYEVNSQTPPMGPGENSVPSPPIPYESAVLRRGVIAANGSVKELPDCDIGFAPELANQQVSLAGSTLAYGCAETKGAVPGSLAPTEIALASISAPGTALATLPHPNGWFQLSGNYAAYLAGEPFKPSRVIVKNVATNTVAYETPQAPTTVAEMLALQEDGSVVLLGQGTSACPTGHSTPTQSYPAEWFPVASPVAHQLGCFYDGALRPVGGKWVALAPGPGSEASLVLVDLATGARTTLAVFPDPGMLEPQEQPLLPAADFDGTRLAWTLETCAGDTVQLTPDVSAMSPGPSPSNVCPAELHIHGALHPGPHGRVKFHVSCPLGCADVEVSVRGPRALAHEFAGFFSLPPSSSARVESFHLGRRQLAYLRRHHRVRITLVATVDRLGGAGFVRYKARATLAG